MKHLRSKSIMSLIYVALLSIPLVSILSRVIYVQCNKNAYQSYYGKTINEYQYNDINNINELELNKEYTWHMPITSFSGGNISIYVEDVENLVGNPTTTYDTTGINTIYLGNDYLQFKIDTTAQYAITTTSYAIEFNFKFTNLTNLNNNVLQYIKYKTYNDYSYLDNVFEYSVNKLVDENNFGKLNFFTWFADLLLDDAQMNMTYVRLANWYMCYALLISLMQILFLVLMWFVNFSRKLLDRGMNYDW